MSSDQNRISETNCQNDPMHVAVTIDINDIYDGALKVLKRIKPFWPINNVQFKVGLSPFSQSSHFCFALLFVPFT